MKKPLVILATNIINVIYLFSPLCRCVNHGQSCKHPRRETQMRLSKTSLIHLVFLSLTNQILIYFPVLLTDHQPYSSHLLVFYSLPFLSMLGTRSPLFTLPVSINSHLNALPILYMAVRL